MSTAFGLLLLAGTLVAAHPVPFLPHGATPFKRLLQSEARKVFGEHAPIALLAAAVEVESSWNPRARSPSGDLGLAQISPSTAHYLNHIRPGPGRGSPRDPKWALSAMSWYLWHLRENIGGAANEAEQWKMMLASYNGGLGHLNRERKLCARAPGCDPSRWSGHIERHRARGWRAFRENRGYLVKVFKRQGAYASWD